MHPVFQSVVLGAFALGLTAATAATDSASFKVKLEITESCTISTTAPTDVDFGAQARSATAANYDAEGQLSVNCSAGTAYTIGLNGGLYSGAAAAPTAGVRKMKHASAATLVPYDLYADSARSTFWGNTTGSLVSGTGTGAAQTIPVYGRLTDVNFTAGKYEDTVTATITY